MFGGGSGVVGDPYLIEDAADLAAVVGENRNNPTQHYLQTANIDLSMYSDWGPIGNVAGGPPFMGVYDGDNFFIDNVTITGANFSPYTGLFGLMDNGGEDVILKNIHVRKANIKGERAGILCGSVYNSEIHNCHVSGIVNGETVGGLTSGLNGSVVTKSSAVNVVLNGVKDGGNHIAGFIAFTSGSTVSDCFATGIVNGKGNGMEFMSGFMLDADTDTNIKNCYHNIVVNNITFDNDNEGQRASSFMQAFAGGTLGHDGLLESCYFDVDSGLSQSTWESGVMYHDHYAYIRGSDGDLYFCIATQNYLDFDVQPPTMFYDARPTNGNRWMEFWEEVTRNSNPLARSTQEMKTKENYIGWDFEKVWDMKPGKYPTLRQVKKGTRTQCNSFEWRRYA